MDIQLSREEIDGIIESLRYSKMKFEAYQYYPSSEFKQKKIDFIQGIIDKFREAKKEAR